jgi:hypothetical protein
VMTMRTDQATTLAEYLEQLKQMRRRWSHHLMLQEGNQCLSLAVDTRRYGHPVGGAEAATL